MKKRLVLVAVGVTLSLGFARRANTQFGTCQSCTQPYCVNITSGSGTTNCYQFGGGCYNGSTGCNIGGDCTQHCGPDQQG